MRNKLWITFLFVLFGLGTIAASCNLNSPIVNSNPTEVAAVDPTQTPYIMVVTATALPPTSTPEASPTVENTATPEPTATVVPPTATLEVTDTVTTTVAGPDLLVTGGLFMSPVPTQSVFNKESSWLIAEPGRLLDASAIFTIPGTNEVWESNCPEGAFWYGSMGSGQIEIDGVTIVLQPENGLNYLVLLRCKIDDAIVDSDLNLTPEISHFVPGHATWAFLPTGAYVSKDWLRDQMVASTTGGYTNCGATGCSRIRIVLFDVDSHYFELFEVNASALDTWSLIEHN